MKILVDAIPMTGLLTGIARYLRNMYTAMSAMQEAELSYLTGGKLVHDMPPLADTVKWQKTTSAVWNLPVHSWAPPADGSGEPRPTGSTSAPAAQSS